MGGGCIYGGIYCDECDGSSVSIFFERAEWDHKAQRREGGGGGQEKEETGCSHVTSSIGPAGGGEQVHVGQT